MNDLTAVETVARAIRAEQCAYYGEPACHRMDEWQDGMDCGDPGCRALAAAAVAAMKGMTHD